VGSWSETRNAARSRSGRAASAMLLRLRPPPTHVLPALGFIGRRVAEPGYHRGQHGKRHPRQRGLRARPRQHDDLLRTGAVCAGNKYGSRPPRWSTDKRANYGRPSAGGGLPPRLGHVGWTSPRSFVAKSLRAAFSNPLRFCGGFRRQCRTPASAV
jgi:hypothetical protein